MSSDPPSKEEIRKLKRKKQEKKMTKILSRAWGLERAEFFQDASSTTTTSSSSNADTASSAFIDLSVVGQKLENGDYPLGKKGWETFAAELGFVYNQFILR